MKTTQTFVILIGIFLSTISFFAQGQTSDQTTVQLPKRLANQTNCTITLINLESRQKIIYVTNFNEHPVIDLASYPSGQIYYYSVTIKGQIVNQGNFFYPLQVNSRRQVATIKVN